MFDKIEKEKNIKIKNIHFRGIGGISMSGIALILKNFGYNITGSDDNLSNQVNILLDEGIKVSIGADTSMLKDVDLFVYTNSIPSIDEEFVYAKNNNIPILERAEVLGEITRKYDKTIAVSGTNGKTTTSSMLSTIFLKAKKKPSIQIGALLKEINSNYVIGESDYFIIEACEYKESFLHFSHETGIILNIDMDHLDYYKNFDNIKKAFYNFAKNTKKGGNLILNYDNEACLELKESLEKENIDLNILTFGLDENADIYAKNIIYEENHMRYKLYIFNKYIDDIILNIFGEINVIDSLAAIAASYVYDIDIEDIKRALKEYKGASRRFELKARVNGANVYDDYAHNPTKVKAVCNTAKMTGKKVWAVFQPHTYTRTKELFNEFVDALSDFENLVIAPIYAAREKDEYNISSKDLSDELKKKNKNQNIEYIETFSDIAKYLKENVTKEDIVILIGAGDIYKVEEYLNKI